jgi:glucan phosphoethanolaminetransferase (alkaline phosphatase superfamily)
MLTAYRIVYGLVLALFLVNVLGAAKGQYSASATTLLILASVLLLAILGLVFRFWRIRPTAFWTLVLGWEILFVWYAWFSPVAPFVFREAHVLDAAGAAKESTVHYLRAGILFGLLFAWFLSLPLARMKWKGRAVDV